MGKKQKTDKTATLTQKHDCSVDALCELGRFPMYIERSDIGLNCFVLITVF